MTDPNYPANEPGVIDVGGGHFLRLGGEAFLWWHGCSARGWRGVGEPMSRHIVENRDPVTIRGSLLCPKCGVHGYVENGKWKTA